MKRKRFLALLSILPGGAALLNACGEDSAAVKKLPEVLVGAAGQPQPDPAQPIVQAPVQSNLPKLGLAPTFDNKIWANSEPLSLAQLTGKVVLMEFWTFGCINCQHVIPSLRDLHSEFSEKGLVIVGMHAPEFDYEKKLENVQDAIKKNEIKYAVAQDNDFATWNKYKVRAWPTLFLVDKKGNIRYNHIGEGSYPETRAAIQSLLAEG